MSRSFLDKVLRLLGIALALYMVARLYGWTTHDNIIKRTVKCKYCRKQISEKVAELLLAMCMGNEC